MYIYKWIEGIKNLEDFCLKRFKEKPRFLETIGHCGPATIWMVYKYLDENDWGKGCTQMFLLFMEHNSGKTLFTDIQEIFKWSYEKIRVDRTSVLKR